MQIIKNKKFNRYILIEVMVVILLAMCIVSSVGTVLAENNNELIVTEQTDWERM